MTVINNECYRAKTNKESLTGGWRNLLLTLD